MGKGNRRNKCHHQISFSFSEDCANAASFLTEACEDIKLVAEVVCCASCMQGTTCEGRRLVNLKETTVQPQEAKDFIVPDVNDFAAAINDRKV